MKNMLRSTMAVLVISAGCSAPPRPDPLIALDGQIQKATKLDTSNAAVKQTLAQAQELHLRASAAYDDGEPEMAAELAAQGSLLLEVAGEQSRIGQAKDRINKAEQRKSDAEAMKTAETERHEKFASRVARMEKIIALQQDLASQKEKSAKEKAQLEAEIEQKKAEQAKLEEEQKKAEEERQKQLAMDREKAEIQSEISVLASKIQTAGSLEAEKFDPAGVNGATNMMAESQRALERGDFAAARKFRESGDQAITAALKVAREAYAKRQQELDVLAQRKALLEAAGQVGASSAHQEERGVVITLHDTFAPRYSDILEERKPVLDAIAQLAQGYATYPLLIEGYTDSQGSEEHNLELSAERAVAVATYLTRERGVGADRVRSAGYGESKPVADNSTQEGRAKNRRIEVVFLFR